MTSNNAAKRPRIAVLISGRGTNLGAMLRQDCGGDVVVVGSNKPDAKGLETAQKSGVATFAISHKDYAEREDFDAALVAALNEHKVDFVVLAGFMRILTPVFVSAFAGRLINIHPSLLPSFTGVDTHARALEAGVKLHGCTVHFVTNELDHGPIIAQAAVQVEDDDSSGTLAAKVLVQEHQILPYSLRLLCQGRLKIEGLRVRVLPILQSASPAVTVSE